MIKKEKERRRRRRRRLRSGTGYEDGQYPFVLYNCAVLRLETKTKLLPFVFQFDYSNKLNDPIVGSLVRNGYRIFNDFILILYGSF